MQNGSIITDQVHSEPGSSRSMPQLNLPQISSIRPGMVPVNLHGAAPPNFSMVRESRQNIHLPYSVPSSSNTMVPPLNYGYLAHGQGPAATTPHNLVPGMQSSLPILNGRNMPFQVPMATLQPPPRGPHPGNTQAYPIGQNNGQVAPNASVGNGLSGLISSLMVQGLISLPKQVYVCSLVVSCFFVITYMMCTYLHFQSMHNARILSEWSSIKTVLRFVMKVQLRLYMLIFQGNAEHVAIDLKTKKSTASIWIGM